LKLKKGEHKSQPKRSPELKRAASKLKNEDQGLVQGKQGPLSPREFTHSEPRGGKSKRGVKDGETLKKLVGGRGSCRAKSSTHSTGSMKGQARETFFVGKRKSGMRREGRRNRNETGARGFKKKSTLYKRRKVSGAKVTQGPMKKRGGKAKPRPEKGIPFKWPKAEGLQKAGP